MVTWWDASSVLVLEAPTRIGSDLLTTLHRTLHPLEDIGILHLRPNDTHPGAGAGAGGEIEVLPGPIDALAAMREAAAAQVLLRSDLLLRLGGLDRGYTTGLALADLERRLHLRGWASAVLPAAIADTVGASRTGSGADRLSEDLEYLLTDPALTPAGIARTIRERLREGSEGPGAVVAAGARVLWHLPRLRCRRRRHRAIAQEAAVQSGCAPAPRRQRSRLRPAGREHRV